MASNINKRITRALVLISAMLLIACSTRGHQYEAKILAARQAADISQHLPVKSAPYTWVLAQSKGAVINITLIKDNAPATNFQRNFPQQLCAQPAVQVLLGKGVSYQIMINDAQGNKQQQWLLTADRCGNTAK